MYRLHSPGLSKDILPALVINNVLVMYSGTSTNCVPSVNTADSCSATFKVQISPRKTRKRSLRKTHSLA